VPVVVALIASSPTFGRSTAADSELQIGTSVDRAFVRYPGRGEIRFTITLRTGPRALEFALALDPSLFRTRRAGIATTEGATMRVELRPGVVPFTLSGSAALQTFSVAQGLPACSPVANVPHGAGQHRISLTLRR
jgi:hypothetical protein